MEKNLPIFPLQMVVFPGQQTGLHIHEAKYKQLIQDSINNQTTFGLLPVINKKLKVRGIEVEIVRINKTYDDGNLDITVRGLRIFTVEDYIDPIKDKLYAGAAVQHKEDDFFVNDYVHYRFVECLRKLNLHLKVLNTLGAAPATLCAYDVAHKIGMSITQQYKLLALESEEARQLIVLNHCIQQDSVESQSRTLKDRVIYN